MHKMGPWGPRHYIFGDQFHSKKARMLRFHEFLHFHARKCTISSFYLKWTKFTRNFEFCSNLVWVREDEKLEQNSQFSGILSKSGKIMHTRHRFNVDTMSYDIVWRRIDVETTSCVYWILAFVPMNILELAIGSVHFLGSTFFFFFLKHGRIPILAGIK